MSKYFTKDEKHGELKGRLWGSNYELTNIKGAKIMVGSDVADELRSAFRKVRPKFYKGDHFTVIYITPRQLAECGATEMCKEFAIYLLQHFNFHLSFYLPGGA